MKHSPGALAKALYSNTPESKNELEFRKGDILTVIEYDYDGQPGWWLCAHRGQRGICPSNYLELLEDKYTLVTRSRLQRSLSQPESGEISESASKVPIVSWKEGEGKVLQRQLEQQQQQNQDEEFDPLDTYDVPRSCVQNLSKSSKLAGEPSRDSLVYSNQPLYQNEDPLLSPVTKTSPLDLYDVPRSQLPIYGQSLARIRKYGHDSEPSLASSSVGSIQYNNNSGLNSSSTHSSSSCDLGLPPPGNSRSNRSSPINNNNLSMTSSNSNISTIPGNSASNRSISQGTSGTSQVQLRHPYRKQPNYPNTTTAGIAINHSNRSSIQSEESGIVMVSSPPMQDLYDVPRSSALPVHVSSNGNGISSSRPQSSLSVSSSGVGLSIANSDSKDSLDLYDVPRSAKSYVNHMETKYDQVHHSRHGSTASLARDQSAPPIPGHSRNNSASSIFSAYGYTRGCARSVPSTDFNDGPRQQMNNFGSRNSVASGSSSNAQNYPTNDLYDVPRSSSNCPPPPNPRLRPGPTGSVASFKSQASLASDGDLDYDVPSSFARKVSLCDSTETLSCQETFGDEARELKLGASSSSLSSSSSHHLRSISQCNNNDNATSGTCDVKILPLGPKAAVSVCEKLRHEVVTSITAILDNVKPKWRSKENLMEIMPELRFSCIRLSLAIKDMADFASRSMSNVKKLGDETLARKLQRLLTPVMNGSQIVQRDVDELEAYFWSVDRLSVAPTNKNHQQDKNVVSGDALDQLILCARSLKHDVTEISNFLALNSSTLFRENDRPPRVSTQMVEAKVEDVQEDYDYVSLMSTSEAEGACSNTSAASLSCKPPPVPPSVQMPQLDSRDQQLLEFYSAQIATTAPFLSQSISTFISSVHQNEPPESFNIHLKYVILMAYKMLFAGDTVHRNVNNEQLKREIESTSNDLHKSILALYEASKIASLEFPKIQPMQNLCDKVWSTTQSATQLKKVIFNATCTSL